MARVLAKTKTWIIGKGSFILSRWYPRYNPLGEKVVKWHQCLLLPGFPIQLWTNNFFVYLENLLGKFIQPENKMLTVEDKRKALVLFFVGTWALSSWTLNEDIGCWTDFYIPYRKISLWIIFSSIKLHCTNTWHWWTSRYLYWNIQTFLETTKVVWAFFLCFV